MFKDRDIVEFDGRRGHIIGVVASSRYINRGRHRGQMKLRVAVLGESEVYYEIPSGLVKKSERTYTDAQIDKALGKQAEIQQQRRTNEHKRASANTEALDGLSVQAGDTILVKGKTKDWKAHVLRVNWANGRVCIRANHNKTGERWLDARHVKRVINEDRPAPVKITSLVLDDLAENGWAQVRYGREFIEQSYVVAFTRELARKGSDYDAASQTVYYDPEWKVYWRSTGSFD